MSWIEARLLSRLLMELSLIKYFWACEATCVGVLLTTKFLDIDLQSPLPYFSKPSKNSRCSSSVHGIPFFLSECCSFLPPEPLPPFLLPPTAIDPESA